MLVNRKQNRFIVAHQKGKQAIKRYHTTEKGDASQQKAKKIYSSTQKGKQAIKRYHTTEKGDARKKTAIQRYHTTEKGIARRKTAVTKYYTTEKGDCHRNTAAKNYNKKDERRKSQLAYRFRKILYSQKWKKKGFSFNILKKYQRMRLNAAAYKATKKHKSVNKKYRPKLLKHEAMKIIRDHCTSDDIKSTFQENENYFDFQRQKSEFKFPNIVCRSQKRINIIGNFLNIDQYIAAHKTDFKRRVAEFLVQKVYHTKRKILLNYPPFKHLEIQGKKSHDRKVLSAVLMAKDLSATIALRRGEWINIFFYNFHVIGDLAKELLAKEELANENDKRPTLLGLKCHQRGIEPYFPSTAFVSGKVYDYSLTKNKTSVDRNHSSDTKDIRNGGIHKPNLYECTDDCIEATDEDCNLFHNLLHTFSNANNKNIRNVLDKYDYCSNVQLNDIYLLPCEKRNHPRMCYEQGCESSSILIRKLAIHHKNSRRFMKISTDLSIAHKFIHDIDVATVLGDIDYLIKLIALSPNKQPSVFNSSEIPPIDFEEQKRFYDRHIANYKKSCLELPDIVCQSCNILEHAKNIKEPLDDWKYVKDETKKEAWDCLKVMLGIDSFRDENIKICNYCVTNYNNNKIPPRSKLNNMDPGDLPKEIEILTPLELMFISKAKVFQTVIKLGAVGKNVPQNYRLSALKGNCIHMPLPLQHTIKQLSEDIDFSKIPSNYIMTHQIKDNELLLRNLVNLNKVYEALVWLKNNNDFYKHIDIPARPDLLFTSLPSEQIQVPSHPSEMASSHLTDSDNEENVVNNGKDQIDDSASNNRLTTKHTNTNEGSVINDHANDPEVIEQNEHDGENDISNMIQKLSSLQCQNMMEQYSVIDSDLQGKSIMDADNLYELLKIDAEPISHKEKKTLMY